MSHLIYDTTSADMKILRNVNVHSVFWVEVIVMESSHEFEPLLINIKVRPNETIHVSHEILCELFQDYESSGIF
jgi:hypothetical protein